MTTGRPTMHDAAKMAGVSLKIVSRVVNNESSVNESTHKRVISAIDPLGFRRNDLAHSLHRGQISSTLGLIIEDIANPPTAVSVDNNRMSVGVLRPVQRCKLPLSLVGFDDIELADMLSVPITVVAHDAMEMGRQAAYLLFNRLADPNHPLAPQHLVLSTHLIVHGSGGAS